MITNGNSLRKKIKKTESKRKFQHSQKKISLYQSVMNLLTVKSEYYG